MTTDVSPAAFAEWHALCTCLQSDGEENAQRLALLTLGEIGRSADLSSYSNLQNVILGGFEG